MFRRQQADRVTHEIQPPPEALRSLRKAHEVLESARERTIQSAIIANSLAMKRRRNHFRDHIRDAVQD